MRKLLPLLLASSLLFAIPVRIGISKGWQSVLLTCDVPFEVVNLGSGERISSLEPGQVLRIRFLQKKITRYWMTMRIEEEFRRREIKEWLTRAGLSVLEEGAILKAMSELEVETTVVVEELRKKGIEVSVSPEEERLVNFEMEKAEEGRIWLSPDPLRFRSKSQGGIFALSLNDSNTKRHYKGEMEIRINQQGVPVLINELELEDYLKAVLPAEISPSFPYECLKAQAIVSRTYALSSLGRHRAEGFDLCNNQHCQTYLGCDYEKPILNKAVDETRGMVITYEGKIAHTPFHTSCGGVTADNTLWGKDLPYLRVRIDGEGKYDLQSEEGIKQLLNSKDFNCCRSPQFRWERCYSKQELERIFSGSLRVLLRNPSLEFNKLVDLKVERRDTSGRVRVLRIESEGGAFHLQGNDIRWAFGNGSLASPGSLPSLLFYIEKEEGKDGVLFRIKGGGYGHGVGFCQGGASALAQKGYKYDEIIKYYFFGVSLTDIRNLSREDLSKLGIIIKDDQSQIEIDEGRWTSRPPCRPPRLPN